MMALTGAIAPAAAVPAMVHTALSVDRTGCEQTMDRNEMQRRDEGDAERASSRARRHRRSLRH